MLQLALSKRATATSGTLFVPQLLLNSRSLLHPTFSPPVTPKSTQYQARAQELLVIAEGLLEQGSSDVARAIATQIVSFARSYNSRSLEGEGLFVLGRCCAGAGDLRGAVDALRAALTVFPEGSSLIRAKASCQYGKLLMATGRWHEAERWLRSAMQMLHHCSPSPYTLHRSKDSPQRVWLAHAYHGLGRVCRELQKPDQAAWFFRRAAILFRHMLGFSSEEAQQCDSELGHHLLDRGIYSGAVMYLRRATMRHEERCQSSACEVSSSEYIEDLLALSEALRRNGDPKVALRVVNKAARFAGIDGFDLAQIVRYYRLRGEVSLNLGRRREAEHFFRNAVLSWLQQSEPGSDGAKVLAALLSRTASARHARGLRQHQVWKDFVIQVEQFPHHLPRVISDAFAIAANQLSYERVSAPILTPLRRSLLRLLRQTKDVKPEMLARLALTYADDARSCGLFQEAREWLRRAVRLYPHPSSAAQSDREDFGMCVS